MAVTFVAESGNTATSGNVTPALPTGWAIDDILILQTNARDNVVCSFPSGWAILNATNNGATLRVTVAWKRAVSGETDPLVTHAAGSFISTALSAWRGATGAGGTSSPFNVVGTPSANASSATITANAITPAVNDEVVFLAASRDLASGQMTSNTTNPTLVLAFSDVLQNDGIAAANATSTTGTATTVNTMTDPVAGINVGQLVSITPAGPPPLPYYASGLF